MYEWLKDDVLPPTPHLLRFMTHLILFFRTVGVSTKASFISEISISWKVCKYIYTQLFSIYLLFSTSHNLTLFSYCGFFPAGGIKRRNIGGICAATNRRQTNEPCSDIHSYFTSAFTAGMVCQIP